LFSTVGAVVESVDAQQPATVLESFHPPDEPGAPRNDVLRHRRPTDNVDINRGGGPQFKCQMTRRAVTDGFDRSRSGMSRRPQRMIASTSVAAVSGTAFPAAAAAS